MQIVEEEMDLTIKYISLYNKYNKIIAMSYDEEK